jgi:hypothetical protein
MITRVEDDRRDPSDDSFDRRWSHMLDTAADLLRGYSGRLLASLPGPGSAAVPGHR